MSYIEYAAYDDMVCTVTVVAVFDSYVPQHYHASMMTI